MFVPDPVISLSLSPKGKETPNFSKALNRFQREDPTFRVHVDAESKEVRDLDKGIWLFSDENCFLPPGPSLLLLLPTNHHNRPSYLVWVSFT